MMKKPVSAPAGSTPKSLDDPALIGSANSPKKPASIGYVVVIVAYAATISGAAMPLGVVARQGERYDEGYLGNNHRFASAPFGSNPPKYRH